jgi:hypothetical protein
MVTGGPGPHRDRRGRGREATLHESILVQETFDEIVRSNHPHGAADHDGIACPRSSGQQQP